MIIEQIHQARVREDWEALPFLVAAFLKRHCNKFAAAKVLEDDECMDALVTDLKSLLESNKNLLQWLSSKEPKEVSVRVPNGVIDFIIGNYLIELKTSDYLHPSWLRQLAAYHTYYPKLTPVLYLARSAQLISVTLPEQLRPLPFNLTVTEIAKRSDLFDEDTIEDSLVAITSVLGATKVSLPTKELAMISGIGFDRLAKLVIYGATGELTITMLLMVGA